MAALSSRKLFFQTFWIKALVAALVLCSPVAFASIVFVRGFVACNFNGQALGSNLLGALPGMPRSVSLWTGIQSLLIFANQIVREAFRQIPLDIRDASFTIANIKRILVEHRTLLVQQVAVQCYTAQKRETTKGARDCRLLLYRHS